MNILNHVTIDQYLCYLLSERSLKKECIPIGVRANIHLEGGQTEFCPNAFSGGGVVADIFRDPYYVGGGGSSIIFPGSILCGVAEFFPLTPVTDPKFVFFFVNCSDRP